MGYRFQFVTLAGFHALNLSMFELASAYRDRGMAGYSALQEREFAAAKDGFTAVRHQREVGTSYFDAVAMAVSGGRSSTTAMAGSTETRAVRRGKCRRRGLSRKVATARRIPRTGGRHDAGILGRRRQLPRHEVHGALRRAAAEATGRSPPTRTRSHSWRERTETRAEATTRYTVVVTAPRK